MFVPTTCDFLARRWLYLLPRPPSHTLAAAHIWYRLAKLLQLFASDVLARPGACGLLEPSPTLHFPLCLQAPASRVAAEGSKTKKGKKKGKAAAAKGSTGPAAGGSNAPAPEEPSDITTLSKPGPEAQAQIPSSTAGAKLAPELATEPLPASHLNAFNSSQAGSTRRNPSMPPKRSGTGHPKGDAQNRGRVPEQAAAAPIEPDWGGFGPLRDMDGLSSGSSNDGASPDEQQADTDDDSSVAKSIAVMIDEEREAAAKAEAAALFSGAGEWQSVLPKKGPKGAQGKGQQVTASVSQHNRQHTLPAHTLRGRATAAASSQQQSRFGSAPAYPPLQAQLPRGIPPQRISQRLRHEAAAGYTSSTPLVGPPAPLHPHQQLPSPSPLAAPQPVQQQQQQPSTPAALAFKARLPSDSNLSLDSLPISFQMPPCLLYADLPRDIGKRVCLVT